MINCPRCGLAIEEEKASFCPHCGGPLHAFSTNLSPEQGSLPSQPILEAPTRILAGPSPEAVHGWGSNYAQPPGAPNTPPTNTAFYGPDQPANQPPSATPAGLSMPALPSAGPPRAMRPRVALSILVLLIVFASGAGVGFFLGKLPIQPAPGVGKAIMPTLTHISSPTPIPVEQIIFTDPLTGPMYPWLINAADCVFKDGSYHILRDFSCYAPIGIQSDVAVSVQAKQVAGNADASYGISLRFVSSGNFYKFSITSNSTWHFVKNVNGKTIFIVGDTANRAIKLGLNTVNTLLVRVKGTHFDFFINGIKVGQANDASFSAGLVGLAGSGGSADVAFNNFQVATLT